MLSRFARVAEPEQQEEIPPDPSPAANGELSSLTIREEPTRLAPAATPQRCPVCAAYSLVGWRTGRASEPHLIERDAYPLARCLRCGSAVTMGAEAELTNSQMYEGGMYSAARPFLDRLIEPLRRRTERERMDFARSIEPGGRVLDIGAGDGRFLAGLGDAGYEVTGIEPSTNGHALARQRGVTVQRLGVEEAEIEGDSQQAVFMWHVLEHLHDPEAALARVREWLVPGGRLIVGVPNLASLQAKLGGNRWFHQDLPRHRTHFTARGLRLMLERMGFRVEQTTHRLIEQNLLGMWQTMLNRLTVERNVALRFIKRDLHLDRSMTAKRDLAVTALAGPLLVPLAIVLEPAAGLIGRGGAIVVEATLPSGE
jgi:2-polyprenyl-3-methyl-5-hydroxy-6-metoxy-1,4-benzoquinol methylase